MSIYQKAGSIGIAESTVPDLTNVDLISIDEALKALEPTVKAFSGIASLYKIITLADGLQKSIHSLTSQKENLDNNIIDLNKTINTLNIEIDNQRKLLIGLKTKQDLILQEFNKEKDKINNEVVELTKQKDSALIKTEQEINQLRINCKKECETMIKEAQDKVKQVEVEAAKAESRLNKATVEFNIIKSKFV